MRPRRQSGRSVLWLAAAAALLLAAACGDARPPATAHEPLAASGDVQSRAPTPTVTPLPLPTEAPVPEPTMRAEATRYARITPLPLPTVVVEGVARAPEVVRLLAVLRKRGIEPQLEDVSRVEMLGAAPGQAYKLGAGWLHLHLYPDAGAANADARQIPRKLDNSIMDWVAPPHFFRCDNVIALYLGGDERVVQALTELCGRQFAGDT